MFSCAAVILYDRSSAGILPRTGDRSTGFTTEMRVIAGKFRSRPLRSIHGLDIRPTSDRLRETLFDVLTAGNPQALEGSVWLDLFAGTGGVGIEALSRGASMVYFVECSRRAAELIKQNLDSLKILQGFRILQQNSSHAISQLDAQGVRANVVFLDPPYRLQNAYRETIEALASSKLAAEATVIAEHEKRFDPGERIRGFAANPQVGTGRRRAQLLSPDRKRWLLTSWRTDHLSPLCGTLVGNVCARSPFRHGRVPPSRLLSLRD